MVAVKGKNPFSTERQVQRLQNLNFATAAMVLGVTLTKLYQMLQGREVRRADGDDRAVCPESIKEFIKSERADFKEEIKRLKTSGKDQLDKLRARQIEIDIEDKEKKIIHKDKFLPVINKFLDAEIKALEAMRAGVLLSVDEDARVKASDAFDAELNNFKTVMQKFVDESFK